MFDVIGKLDKESHEKLKEGFHDWAVKNNANHVPVFAVIATVRVDTGSVKMKFIDDEKIKKLASAGCGVAE